MEDELDDDTRAFIQVLELPAKRDADGVPAVYDPNEVVFMDFGSCKGEDPAWFDTDTNKGKTSRRGSVTIRGRVIRKAEQIETARRICRACPVLDECASFIKRYPEDEGIWAGLLPEERVA